jgi:MOSC domain-containing protein YiiM
VRSVPFVEAEAGKGLVGDRYHGTRHRHVTVQSEEELRAAATDLGRAIPPSGTRRNLTVSHGQVPTTPGTLVRIGPVLLEVVRVVAPCRLLEDELGPGAPAALRRRAGAAFRVLEGGVIRLDDPMTLSAELP